MKVRSKKILVIGSEGQLGSQLQCMYPNALVTSCDPTDQSKIFLDLLDSHEISLVLEQVRPEIIINAAAYTAVDKAEQEYEKALKINSEAVEIMAHYAKNSESLLIHFSTDYVYSAVGAQPITENEPTNPINNYGKSKLIGDQVITKSGCRHYILRTSWVFSPYGHNFVKTMKNLILTRDQIQVVHDQIGAPTSVFTLAEAVATILNADWDDPLEYGIYHITNLGYVSWYEFAVKIKECLNQHSTYKLARIEPITSDQFVTVAKRPINSRLDIGKFIKATHYTPRPFEVDLSKTVAQLV